MELMTFKDALVDASRCKKRHVLLGNGFSIACRPDIFLYGRLYDNADFGSLSPTAKLAFEALNTQDFEKVIKALRDATKILVRYGGGEVLASTFAADADALRELLVQTIAVSHPAWPGEISNVEYEACREFLKNFDNTYTLNYDLLLYWAHMHSQASAALVSDDGFRKSEDDFDAGYVVWDSSQSHQQNLYFLHGALHVFDTGIEIQKYTWINTGIRLVDQIRDALKRDFFPVFVAEGTSDEKLERIRHSDYLAKGYRSFTEITGALFIYGHSLAPNDEHYLRRIEKGRLSHVYIGIYGDPESESNRQIIVRGKSLANARAPSHPLAVHFFDSATAKVWG
jgi:hypothetical protein